MSRTYPSPRVTRECAVELLRVRCIEDAPTELGVRRALRGRHHA